jgi:invasion protein IalB
MHRDLMDRLKAGNRATVQVRSPVARVNYAVSLVGFTAANERILEMCRK